MSKLAFDAFGKYIHPTSYRQIVETESLNQLTSEEQRILSENQIQSSAVAKVHYQKRRSREESKGLEVDEDKQARFGVSTSSSTLSTETLEKVSLSPSRKGVIPTANVLTQRKLIRHMKFSADEDECLKKRINNHGCGQKMAILRDCEFKFQERRTAGSLKKRAGLKFSSVDCPIAQTLRGFC